MSTQLEREQAAEREAEREALEARVTSLEEIATDLEATVSVLVDAMKAAGLVVEDEPPAQDQAAAVFAAFRGKARAKTEERRAR